MNLLFSLFIAQGFLSWSIVELTSGWIPDHPSPRREDCSVFLYFSKMFYEILSKIVASRAWRCALFRLASAKVGQVFEPAKKPWIFFQKKFSFGCFACSSWQFKRLYRAYWAVCRVFWRWTSLCGLLPLLFSKTNRHIGNNSAAECFGNSKLLIL